MKHKYKIRDLKPKTIAYAIGLGSLLWFSVMVYYTFLRAYFNGNYKTTVWVNGIGEAHFEFVLLPICLVFGVYVFIDVLRDHKRWTT